MTVYFLHLRDDTGELLDPEGVTLLTEEALVRAMYANARELIAHDALRGEIDFGYRIDAETRDGRIVHTLAFRDAVKLVRV